MTDHGRDRRRRVPRWKHTLYDWLKVTKAELAVIIELLLRGPQTEGELRARVSRMEPWPISLRLQSLLEALDAPRPGRPSFAPGPEAWSPGHSRSLSARGARKGSPRRRGHCRCPGDDEAPARVSAARVGARPRRRPHRPGPPRSPRYGPTSMSCATVVDDSSAEIRELKSGTGV